MKAKNVFDDIPSKLTDELFTSIHRAKCFHIERIVSQGHCSPEGFWCDQNEHEWVILLEGNASIQFEGYPEPMKLHRGSYINIPAHTKHRVLRTSPTEQTIWLAIHYVD